MSDSDNHAANITAEVLDLLREAGLDGILVRIEAIPKEDQLGFDYQIHHAGTEADEAAILGAFKDTLQRHGVVMLVVDA
jgi:hypothetical protein